jgi:4a-hydroxytetrahydrobiopterin dehydratase
MTQPLSRQQASEAVEQLGWRYLLGTFCTSVAVSTLAEAAELAAIAVSACTGAEEHLRADLRTDRLELCLETPAAGQVTTRDVELAEAITSALDARTRGATTTPERRAVQMLEIAIDAMDIPAIRPFWKAVLAYGDEVGYDGTPDTDSAVLDPAGQGPTIWFQQMDEPRVQRNRIHFDITVSHDEADARVAAALAAGGQLVSDRHARSFWVLADVEGNEICVCTWQDRDGRDEE